MTDDPRSATARFDIVLAGSLTETGGKVVSTCSLIRVPGHTAEDIATVIGTPEGIVVCTHLWWNADGPVDDPSSEDPEQLHASRRRVLNLADVIVPGHGAPFRPS